MDGPASAPLPLNPPGLSRLIFAKSWFPKSTRCKVQVRRIASFPIGTVAGLNVGSLDARNYPASYILPSSLWSGHAEYKTVLPDRPPQQNQRIDPEKRRLKSHIDENYAPRTLPH